MQIFYLFTFKGNASSVGIWSKNAKFLYYRQQSFVASVLESGLRCSRSTVPVILPLSQLAKINSV